MAKNKTINRDNKVSVMALFFSIVLWASFYSSKLLTDPYIMTKHIFAMIGGSIALLAGAAYYFLKKYKLTYPLNKMDLAILALLVYVLLNETFRGNAFYNNVHVLNIVICSVLYFLYKPILTNHSKQIINNSFANTLVSLIIIIGALQALLGLAEYFKVYTIQTDFKVGCAFGNPGPYANFITAILPISLFAALKGELKFHKYGGIISSLLIFTILPLTEARTAFIGAAVALAFASLYIKRIQKILQWFVRNRLTKILSAIGLLIIIAGFFVALLSFKKESASGRLFVWKVSTEIIKDKPLFGHGYGKFAPTHNKFQSAYFAANPTDTENAFLADCVNFAFNEFIQITAEVGIVGLLLFLAIIYFIVMAFVKTKEPGMFFLMGCGTALVILVSAMFSYPFRIEPNLFLFFVSLHFINANNQESTYNVVTNPINRKLASAIGVVLALVWLNTSLTRFKAEKAWYKAYKMVREKQFDQAKHEYARLSNVLHYNPFFGFNYGAELAVMQENKKGIEVLSAIEDRFSEADLYIYKGTCYGRLGKTNEALKCFEFASNMVPNRFFPRYKMVQIYDQMGNYEKAIALAKEILELPVKVESVMVQNIRAEVETYLSIKEQEKLAN